MAKLVFLLAPLCFLALLSSTAYAHGDETYHVEGKVYCDTCRALFETSVSEYIAGAKVKLECRDRTNYRNKTFSVEGVTDASGTYSLPVVGDHEEDICEVILVESPRSDCDQKHPHLDRARVLCTKNNGVITPVRFANPLGFAKRVALDVCPKVIAALGLLPEQVILPPYPK